MSANLKPCPFCGGEPDSENLDDDVFGEVSCARCDITMMASAIFSEDAPDVISAWNRRAAASDLHVALTEVMAAFRAYQSKPGPAGLQRIAAAEKQADAALAKAEGRS